MYICLVWFGVPASSDKFAQISDISVHACFHMKLERERRQKCFTVNETRSLTGTVIYENIEEIVWIPPLIIPGRIFGREVGVAGDGKQVKVTGHCRPRSFRTGMSPPRQRPATMVIRALNHLGIFLITGKFSWKNTISY